MQIPCAMQDPQDLNSIRQFAVENQITAKTINAPRTDFRKTQIRALSANAGISGKKFKRVVSRFQKQSRGEWIVAMDELRHHLQIAEDKLALIPAGIHLSEERILEMLERSPGWKRPCAASASFSRTRGGVSLCG
jgi:hypothetical protein